MKQPVTTTESAATTTDAPATTMEAPTTTTEAVATTTGAPEITTEAAATTTEAPATTASTVSMCSGIKQDCRSSQCCSDPSLTCYSKNEWWAECKASCVPDVDPTDPIEFQTPWSCVALPFTGTTTGAPACSVASADRWGPNLGGCCSGLEACVEPRAIDDSNYCDTSNPQHGLTCWSNAVICRSQCSAQCAGTLEDCQSSQCCSDPSRTCYSKDEWWAQCKVSCTPGIDPADPVSFQTPWSCAALPLVGTTTAAPSCSVEGADRWGPNLGGCCNGLQQCVEGRPVADPYYCALSDPNHGLSCWSSTVICRTDCSIAQGITAQDGAGGLRRLGEALFLVGVEAAERSTAAMWIGFILGLVCTVSSTSLWIRIMGRKNNPLQGLLQNSVYCSFRKDLVQCHKVNPQVEEE